jgi:PKD repeat protein
MRKTVLSTLLILLAYGYALSQISFFDATDSLRYGTLRSGAPMAIADMNADGLDDIVCLDSRRFLYIEYQQADTSVFDGVFYGDIGSNQWSICISDVDSNGYNDIFTGGSYNGLHLITANADGSNYNFDVITDPSIFLQGSNFIDIDTDGYADIFAAHDDGLSVPFKNNGSGNFTPDYTLINAVSTVPSDNSGNYGTVWTDYDNDGDLDLYISKCRLGVDDPTDPRRLNLLFQNDGQNNFTDVAAQANLLPFGQSWASDFGDIDNDGDLDCFIINHDIANSLYRNNGNGTFTNISGGLIVPLSSAGIGMQVKFVDFDNDTYLDILYTSLGTIHAVLHNNGDGTFTNVSDAFPINERIHSATVGDLNNDGFIDVYAGYGFGYNQISNQHDRLFYNTGNDNHFMKILLKGTTSNTNAIGARLELYGPWGKQIREVRSGESYGIMTSYTSHFGLGQSESADSLYIYWPSGNVDRLISPPADTMLMITEGQFCLPFAGFEYSSPGLNVQLTGNGDVGVDEWAWTFEGGDTLSGQQVNYTFPEPGQYLVCLNTEGSCGSSQYCELVEVECVTLEGFFTFQSDGLDLSFEDLSFGGPSNWLWEFGDGNTSTEQNPLHGYDVPGNYFVCLNISNECGNAGFCQFINVSCDEVTTAFDKDINDLQVSFTDFSSAGTNEWMWDFGDGNTSNEENPVHLYAAPGTYEVCLTINGECGGGTYCEQISVFCSVPEASFLVFDDELSVDFQDNTDHIPTAWSWDFGDGNTSSEQNPTHIYDAPGFYNACLIASNVCGIDTFCRALVITCDAPIADYATQADGLSYSFIDVSENEPEGRAWLVNDTVVSTAPTLDYLFAQPGMYEVCLQVENICGADTLCQVWEVTCATPAADFAFEADELSLTFSDASSAGPSSWEWYVEDVLSGQEDILDYTFPGPGEYEVCLIASNVCGADTSCQMVSVSCSPPQAGFEYDLNGLSGTFTDTSTNMPTAWLWLVNDIPAGQSNILNYFFPVPDDYEVCLIAGSQCGSDTVCTIVSLNCLPPQADFNFVADGLAVTFNDLSTNEPDSWQWTVNSDEVGDEPSLLYEFPTDGSYTVCLEVSNGCDISQACQSVSVTCNASSSAFSFSQDELMVSFTDESTDNATSWNWDFGDGNTSGGQNPAHVYTTPGTYTVCLNIENNCNEIDQSCQQVSVDCAPPQATFSSSSNLLLASFTDLSSGSPVSWNWDFGDGNTSGQQNPQHLYSDAGIYTVCLRANSICGFTEVCQEVEIICPVPDAGFTLTIDELSVVLTDTSMNNPGFWNWTFGDGNTSIDQNPSHSYAAPGQYIICLTASSSCGFTQQCRQITVGCAAPEAAFGLQADELSASFTDQSNNNPDSWSWDFGDGNTSTLANPSHDYAAPGTYEVCLTASSICGSTTSCEQLTVSCQAPQANYSLQANELSYTFNDNSTNQPDQWFWTFGDGATSTEQNAIHVYELPGTYEVCLTASSICGSDLFCQSIEVACSAPQANYAFNVNELNVSFLDNSSGTVENWEWNFGDGTTSTLPNPSHTYANPGSYTVCLTTSSICGSTQSCEVIEVSCQAPLATFASSNNQLEVSFLDISSNSPTQWSWDFGDGSTSTDQNPVHLFEEPGTYTVCLTASSICGSSQFCSQLEVNCMAPQANFEISTQELTLNFMDVSENNPSSWMWSFGDGTTSTQQNPQHTYDFPGNYLVCLSVSSICGNTQRCELTTVSCTPPQSAFDYNSTELTVNFQDASTEDAVAWLWDFGDGSGSTQASPAHNYLLPGEYEVCLTVSNLCGSTTSCSSITVNCTPTPPLFDFSSNGLTINFANLTADLTLDWIWSFGDGNTSASANPIYTYSQEGIYEVCLIASGLCGQDTLCQEINLILDSDASPGLLEPKVTFFPNPASNIGYIRLKDIPPTVYEWTMLNSQGKKLLSGQGNSLEHTPIQLDDLPAGLYWLSVNIEGVIVNKKVVKGL